MPPDMKIPDWIKEKRVDVASLTAMKSLLRNHRLHTVCEEAKCPNIGECFGAGTATFLIMGDVCTRNCLFCGVKHGKPSKLDPKEPERIAQAAADLNLKHVVITSVTRDDLKDGGSSHFVETMERVRAQNPGCTLEVLVPDFKGDKKSVVKVLEAKPDVFNHNIETVPQVYPLVRHKAVYSTSLEILSLANQYDRTTITKSGLMVGLGESIRHVKDVMIDLRACGVSVVTIGQYLRPPGKGLKVRKYYTPEEFKELEEFGYGFGFAHVSSGAFVRSSFHASEALQKIEENQR
jgi:lipoic acid synthetase